MQHWSRQIALCYAAGCAGALAQSGVIWGGVHIDATKALAWHLAHAQYPHGFYPRVVWSGIVALLFLLPVAARRNWALRGLLWGVVAAVLQVVVVPLVERGGVHFTVAPLLFVLLLSCIWGLVTAAFLRLIGT